MLASFANMLTECKALQPSMENAKMFESFDESKFQAYKPIPSATPMQDALHDIVQGTVSECKEGQGYSI